MKKSVGLLFILFGLIIPFQGLFAQWIPAQGMDGANTISIIAKDSLIFVSSDVDIQRRNVLSGSWQQVLRAPYSTLKSAGNYLFVYTWYYLYRSASNGQSWDTIHFPVESFVTIDTMLFRSFSTNIDRSDDYGTTWYSVKNNIPGQRYYHLFANGNTLFALDYTGQKIYKSDNAGMFWDTLSSAGLGTALNNPTDIYKYQTTYWLASNPGIYKYNDVTHNWNKMNDTLSFYSFGEYQGVLYGCGNGFFQLGPNWNTWIARNNGLDASEVHVMCSKDTLLYCGTEQGPYRTYTSLLWQPWYDGLHGGQIYSISCHGNEIWVCSSLGIHKSTNNGSSFEKKPYSNTKGFQKIIITDSIYFALTNKGFYISYDYGESWVKEINGLPAGFSVRDFSLGDEYIFLLYGTYSGDLYRSHYSPVQWEIIPALSDSFYAPLAAHGSTFIVNGNYDPYPYITARISHNNGNTIDSLPLTEGWVYPFIKYDHGKFFICDYRPIYSSDDDGYSWTMIPMSIPEYHGASCSENDVALVAVGWMYEYYGVAYITYDHGATWTDIADNLLYQSPFFEVTEINQNRILLGTSAIGLWYRDDLITGLNPSIICKNDFFKIYPNPAIDKLYLSFNNPENSYGKILVYNIQGTTIYNGRSKLYLKGYNHEEINTSNFPGGMFIISLKVNDTTHNRKFFHLTH